MPRSFPGVSSIQPFLSRACRWVITPDANASPALRASSDRDGGMPDFRTCSRMCSSTSCCRSVRSFARISLRLGVDKPFSDWFNRTPVR